MIYTQLPVHVGTQRVKEPRLELYYPAVYGLGNPEAQQRINLIIQKQVKKMLIDQGFYSDARTQVTASYELKNNQRGILSLSLNNYAFAGGAHGITIIRSLTFDINTGRLYSLTDAFKPSANYQEVLSLIIEQQIVDRHIPLINEFTGIKPDQDYYIADKILVIYYQLYELTAYAFGFPEFPITVYQIEDIINERGPLGRMLPAIGVTI